jgi:guanine deaminase
MNTPGGPKRIFKATVRNPVSPDRVDTYVPGYLVTRGNVIEELAKEDPRPRLGAAEYFDLGNQTIVPGFVDTHVHLPQLLIMGISVGELLSWLTNYTYPEETRFADPRHASEVAQRFFDEIVANGTTTAVIYSSVHEEATDIAFSTAQAKGIRAFIGKVMMDRNVPDVLLEGTDQSVAASLRLFEKWDGANGGRLRYVFTPRFAGSCSIELMERIGKIAHERGAFIQSHLSENIDEIAWVRSLFPDLPSYAAIYDSAGMLSERTIMAHCIHLSSEEIALMARRKTSVAFCPYSNRTLRSGTMPYSRLRDAGLNIGLGSDIAGGPSLSMMDEIDQAVDAVHIPEDEALYLATLGGAKSIGLADCIGSFESGKDADFVVLDGKTVRKVYVQGKLVYFSAR